MTIITLNKRTRAGKLLLEMAKMLSEKNAKDVVIMEEEEAAFSPEFLAKIKKAEENVKAGKTVRVNPQNIWESIL